MNKVIFDFEISGHHSEYIDYILTFLVNDKRASDNYFFILHPDFFYRFPYIVKRAEECKNVNIYYLEKSDIDALKGLSIVKKSFKIFNIMNTYAKKMKADHVLLMSMNIFQLPLVFRRPSFMVSGILFLQFYRMQKKSFKEKLKYYRKYWTTKLYAINPKIKSVFILNDELTVSFLNRAFSTGIFKMLPDPIPQHVEEDGFDLYTYYNIPKEKKVLLHPGAIDPRKGTYEIIESIDLLSSEAFSRYAILIVGKANQDTDRQIRKRSALLRNKDFVLVYDNTFVSNERLKSMFAQSYAVLIPYKNPEASSGILGHAMTAGTPVIAPDYGLLGDIVRSNGVGITIVETTGYSIAKAIEMLENIPPFSTEKISDFIDSHSTLYFAERVMGDSI